MQKGVLELNEQIKGYIEDLQGILNNKRGSGVNEKIEALKGLGKDLEKEEAWEYED